MVQITRDDEKAIVDLVYHELSLVAQIGLDCNRLGNSAGMTGEEILGARCLYYERMLANYERMLANYERKLAKLELDREQDNMHPAARLVDELIKLYEKEKR